MKGRTREENHACRVEGHSVGPQRTKPQGTNKEFELNATLVRTSCSSGNVRVEERASEPCRQGSTATLLVPVSAVTVRSQVPSEDIP